MINPDLSSHVLTLMNGILSSNVNIKRRSLAKAITLLESTRALDREKSEALLAALLAKTADLDQSIRIGISGAPGAGKSTFIEAIGLYAIAQNKRVAVLTIDPSSSLSGGSILGDKTRMDALSVSAQAFIRPSPSSGYLGGVAKATREAMLLCEAAGFDLILVETVGVGQSETNVASMTDMLVLLQLPNAGDDLQAIKKGIVEVADMVVVNKADLNQTAAEHTAQMWQAVVKGTPVLLCSAQNKQGMAQVWEEVVRFCHQQQNSGAWDSKRQSQRMDWLNECIHVELLRLFEQRVGSQSIFPEQKKQVMDGKITASSAARQLLASLLAHQPQAMSFVRREGA